MLSSCLLSLAQVLNNRPDVHAAEMKLAACFHDVQTARSRFYPSIKISGAATYTNSAGSGIINPGKWLLSAVGSLTQPIFANGQLIAGLKVAKAQQVKHTSRLSALRQTFSMPKFLRSPTTSIRCRL